MRDLAAAVTFLTRLRLRSPVRGAADLAPAVPWFPVVGGLIGLAVGAVHVGAAALMPPLMAAAIAVMAGLLLTGALHEDGLADTADGIGGGWSAEERLEIMRDPRHGTYGVLALIASVGVRTVALSFLGGWGAVAGLMAAHALSRSATGVLLAAVPPATEEGLGAAYGRLWRWDSSRSLQRAWPRWARPRSGSWPFARSAGSPEMFWGPLSRCPKP